MFQIHFSILLLNIRLPEAGHMADQIIVQYLGFKAGAQVREYTFVAQEAAREPREYTLTIANEAFESHRARYQDGPDICSLRLRREFRDFANHPPTTHFSVTDADLADYQDSRKVKVPRRFGGNNAG
jgi:hypothetical protein